MLIDASALVSLVAGLFLWVLYYGYNFSTRNKYRHFPGPHPSWLLGNAGELRTGKLVNVYANWSKQFGSIFVYYLGLKPMIVVSDPEAIRQLGVKYFSQFHDRNLDGIPVVDQRLKKLLDAGLVLARGSYWASMRAAVQPMFHSGSLSNFAKGINRNISLLLDAIAETSSAGKPVNVSEYLGRMTMDVIGETALGIPFGAQIQHAKGAPETEVVEAAKMVFRNNGFALTNIAPLLPAFLRPLYLRLVNAFPSKGFAELIEGRSRVVAVARTLVKNRQAAQGLKLADSVGVDGYIAGLPSTPRLSQQYAGVVPAPGSIIDLMAASRNKETGQPFELHQIVATTHTMILAGYETTSAALSAAIYYLALDPDATARLTAEVDSFGLQRVPGYDDLSSFPWAEAVLNEGMRLLPPAFVIPRACTADTTLTTTSGREVFIPARSVVHMDVWSLHHDPQLWPEPERFNPARFLKDSPEAASRHPYAFIPFGVGPRMCVGYKFAMQEAVLALVRLYQAFTFTLDPARTQVPPPLRVTLTIAIDGVWVIATPRL